MIPQSYAQVEAQKLAPKLGGYTQKEANELLQEIKEKGGQ